MVQAGQSLDLKVEKLFVWYHFPISLLDRNLPGKLEGWQLKPRNRDETSTSQFTYFHPYIADALFDGGKDSRFKVYRRAVGGSGWKAEFCEKAPSEDLKDLKAFTYHRFCMTLGAVELWVASKDGSSIGGGLVGGGGTRDGKTEPPGLAILSVAVEITGIAKQTVLGDHNPEALDKAEFRDLTLADAMNALEWIRRVFPRWRVDSGFPGDSLSQIITPDGHHWPAHNAEQEEKMFREKDMVRLFPWVEKLLWPLSLDGVSARHLGDERAFMCSAIALKTPAGMDDRAALRLVHDGTLFRLAEADRAGSGDYAYNSAFLETLRDRYFYTRHAPDMTKEREGIGNSTMYLMSQHHLCALGTGWFAANDMIKNMERYYRHMQFLCVFEYFRLVQFSQRLTKVVQGNPKANYDQVFREEVLKIRKDFLEHTHLHHYTNVSSQLQAKEMFDRLHAVTGIPELFDEVERELETAADYAALLDARDQAKRGEELNELVSVGVPASLALTVAGFVWVTGEKGPDVPFFAVGGSPFTAGLVQVSALLTLALVLWAGLRAALKLAPLRRLGGLSGLVIMVILTVFLALIHQIKVGVPEEHGENKHLTVDLAEFSGGFSEKLPRLQPGGGNLPKFVHADSGLQRVSLQTLPG